MRASLTVVVSITLLAISPMSPASLGKTAARADPTTRPSSEQSTSGRQPVPLSDSRQSMCLLIEAAARGNDLPLDFFARVIWQESRFQTDAIGPVTRGGKRAQGIAQFMPGTAAQRGLLDPFNPVQALPKAAELLRDLRAQFGNVGLAAAAYNAGAQRIRAWMARGAALSGETRNYVLATTGRPIEDWADGKPGSSTGLDCQQLMALLERGSNQFVSKLRERLKLVAAKPWGVQLSAGFSRDRVLADYATLTKRYSDILNGRDPSILSALIRSRGTRAFYQVRIGADSRDAADKLCGRIKGAGGACIVLRNRTS